MMMRMKSTYQRKSSQCWRGKSQSKDEGLEHGGELLELIKSIGLTGPFYMASVSTLKYSV